jgi:hypothetical protein
MFENLKPKPLLERIAYQISDAALSGSLIKLAAKTKEPTEPETGRTTILRKEESHHV